MKNNNLIILIMSSMILLSCTSSQTIRNPEESEASGINYYMPMKDLIITIETNTAKEVKSVSVNPSPSYPDMSTQYVLKYSRNFFGKNTMDIAIKENGLLTKSNSTTVSAVNSSLTGLAQSYANLSLKITGDSKKTDCIADRTYTFLKTFSELEALKKDSVDPSLSANEELGCGLKYNIKNLFDDSRIKNYDKINISTEKHFKGIFYKQYLPYLVTILDEESKSVYSKIIHSPSFSKTFYMPSPKGFFANNKSELGFNDGVLTTAIIETESELSALLKLPADVFSAYFDAVGGIFEKKSGVNTKEAAYLNSTLSIEKLRMKHDLCMNAIKNDQTELIEELNCGTN